MLTKAEWIRLHIHPFSNIRKWPPPNKFPQQQTLLQEEKLSASDPNLLCHMVRAESLAQSKKAWGPSSENDIFEGRSPRLYYGIIGTVVPSRMNEGITP